jgi:CBS domain containing-hemolysin-like protein
VSARLPIEDLGELFDLTIEDDDIETVGGLIAYALGRVPLPGASLESHGLSLRTEGGEDMRGRIRVSTVLVQRAHHEDTADAEHLSEHTTERAGSRND